MVEKTIKIGDKDCHLKCAAAVCRMYRDKFNRDMLIDMPKLMDLNKNPDASEVLENATYIMHKFGDPSQPDDVYEWLGQFGLMDIYSAAKPVVEIWESEMKSLSVNKKK